MLKRESAVCRDSGMTLNRILSLPFSDIVKHVQLFTFHNCTCAQVSEVDMTGAVLRSFTDLKWPRHLSLDSEGQLLVADCFHHHILLLNSQLKLQRVLIDHNSQVELRYPRRLCYNDCAQQLYVLHEVRTTLSVFRVR